MSVLVHVIREPMPQKYQTKTKSTAEILCSLMALFVSPPIARLRLGKGRK